MNFPDSLIVLVLDKNTNAPVKGAAIVLELFASRKNNYVVGPAISDLSGQVRFTREECERSIKADQEMFIMDYMGTLADCRPVVEVRLHSPAHLAKMLEQHQAAPRFWGRDFKMRPSFSPDCNMW
jgi:hypothetical protein